MPRKQKPFPLDLLFRALADPTRLRLLNLVADKEICVCYFVGILGMSQPKISRHLAYLRHAGIVATRRQGRWMHYRLLAPGDAAASAILKETLAHLRTSRTCKEIWRSSKCAVATRVPPSGNPGRRNH